MHSSHPSKRSCFAGAFTSAWLLASAASGAVPIGDITLQPVVTQNLPVILSLSGYSISENTAGGVNRDLPMFYPYDNGNADWWDNLIAEQLQARMPVIMVEVQPFSGPVVL